MYRQIVLEIWLLNRIDNIFSSKTVHSGWFLCFFSNIGRFFSFVQFVSVMICKLSQGISRNKNKIITTRMIVSSKFTLDCLWESFFLNCWICAPMSFFDHGYDDSFRYGPCFWNKFEREKSTYPYHHWTPCLNGCACAMNFCHIFRDEKVFFKSSSCLKYIQKNLIEITKKMYTVSHWHAE